MLFTSYNTIIYENLILLSARNSFWKISMIISPQPSTSTKHGARSTYMLDKNSLAHRPFTVTRTSNSLPSNYVGMDSLLTVLQAVSRDKPPPSCQVDPVPCTRLCSQTLSSSPSFWHLSPFCQRSFPMMLYAKHVPPVPTNEEISWSTFGRRFLLFLSTDGLAFLNLYKNIKNRSTLEKTNKS